MNRLREKQRLDRDAFKTLGFEVEPDDITVDAVDARWRELRSTLHPDKPTGDAARFHECRLAYEAARFYALEIKPCKDCNGVGRVERKSGSVRFAKAQLLINCSVCRGSGRR